MRALHYIAVIVLAATAACGGGVEELATAEDGHLVLTRHQSARGCGGDKPATLFLNVHTEKEKLRSRLPHTCGPGAGDLRLSPNRRLLLTRCSGQTKWHLTYLLFGVGGFSVDSSPVVNFPEMVADPGDDWSALPELWQTAGVFAHDPGLANVLLSVRALDGGAAHARALADTVESRVGGWQTEYEYLAEEHRAPVLAALREAARKPEPESLALRRAAANLPDEDRPMLLPRLLEIAGHPKEASRACDALESLAPRRTDDLAPLACELLDRSCRTEALHVLATTDGGCDRLEAWTTKWLLCDGKTCEGRICTADELATKLPEAIQTRDEGDVALKQTIMLHAALRRRPTSLAAAQFRLDRSSYELDTSVMCRSKDDCPCGKEEFLRSVVCAAPASAEHARPKHCVVEMDDDARVLRRL